jgi:CRP-like cAMP-binding protein
MRPRPKARPFDAQAFLDSAGLERTVPPYQKGETIYSQGQACLNVLCLQSGEVTLSVLSQRGREAIVAILGPASFFGEGGLSDRFIAHLLTRNARIEADLVGTTRSRVNFFLNRFKKLGFIEDKEGLTIHGSLLSVVLHD